MFQAQASFGAVLVVNPFTVLYELGINTVWQAWELSCLCKHWQNYSLTLLYFYGVTFILLPLNAAVSN